MRARSGSGRRRARSAAAATVGGIVLLCTATARGEPYRVDLAQSELVVRVFKAGPASALAHDHVVRAPRWEASLDVNRDPVALAADIRVDARALEVDEPEVRARHQLDGVLSEDDRAEVRATMLGSSQLDVASHPEIRFRAAEIDRAGAGYRLAGELSLRGRTKRIVLPISVAEAGSELRARGTVRVALSDFGIEPYRAFLGAVRNQDEVELVVTIVASPADAR